MDWILPLSWTWQGANSLNSVSTVNYWVSSVKEFHSQELVLYLMYQYSFILLPKMYAPCPNPSPIWVTSDVPKVIIVIIQIFMWCVVIDICYVQFYLHMSCSIYATSNSTCFMSECIYGVFQKTFDKLQFTHNMGKNSSLCVPFCCTHLAIRYERIHVYI